MRRKVAAPASGVVDVKRAALHDHEQEVRRIPCHGEVGVRIAACRLNNADRGCGRREVNRAGGDESRVVIARNICARYDLEALVALGDYDAGIKCRSAGVDLCKHRADGPFCWVADVVVEVVGLKRDKRRRLDIGSWRRRGISVDLRNVGGKSREVRGIQRHAAVSCDGVGDGRCAPVMQIRRGGPCATQRGSIECRQRAAEPFARGWTERANVVHGGSTVRELRAAVARGAVLRAEDLFAESGVRGEGAVGVPRRAGRSHLQKCDVCSERVEVRAAPGFRHAERCAGCREIGIRKQPGSTAEIANLSLEILHFIKVRRPMQRSLRHTAVASQRDCIAKPLTKSGKVPSPPVVSTVIVARSAGNVALEREPWIESIVEMLLPEQHLRGKALAGHGADSCRGSYGLLAAVLYAGNIMNADVARHEVLHKQRPAIGRKGESLRCAIHKESLDDLSASRIAHCDLTRRFEGHVEIRAGRVEDCRARHSSIVEIKSRRGCFEQSGEINSRGNRAHGLVVVKPHAFAQGAEFDVVLLGRNPCGAAIGRNRRGSEIVRNSAGGGGCIHALAVLENHGAIDGGVGRVHDDHFAAVLRRAHRGLRGGGILAGDRGSDEAGNKDTRTVRANGNVPRMLAQRCAREDRAGRRVQF